MFSLHGVVQDCNIFICQNDRDAIAFYNHYYQHSRDSVILHLAFDYVMQDRGIAMADPLEISQLCVIAIPKGVMIPQSTIISNNHHWG